MNSIKNSFIQNLKVLMAEKNITQTILASKLQVDQTTISAWLRGESEPSLTKICLIMKFFNVSFEDLID